MQPVVGSRHQNVARGVPGAGPNSAERTLPADYMDLHFLFGGGKSQQVSKQARSGSGVRRGHFHHATTSTPFFPFFLAGVTKQRVRPASPTLQCAIRARHTERNDTLQAPDEVV